MVSSETKGLMVSCIKYQCSPPKRREILALFNFRWNGESLPGRNNLFIINILRMSAMIHRVLVSRNCIRWRRREFREDAMDFQSRTSHTADARRWSFAPNFGFIAAQTCKKGTVAFVFRRLHFRDVIRIWSRDIFRIWRHRKQRGRGGRFGFYRRMNCWESQAWRIVC